MRIFEIVVICFLSRNFVAAQTQDQNFTFPAGGEFLDVGQTYTIIWHALISKYPSVTIVMWDSTADGVFFPLAGLDFITNTGSVSWTVPEYVGPHRLGVGTGTAGALGNNSASGVFTIRRPVSLLSTSSGASTSVSTQTGKNSLAGSQTATSTVSISTASSTLSGGSPTDTVSPFQTPGFASVSGATSRVSGSKRSYISAIFAIMLLCIGEILT